MLTFQTHHKLDTAHTSGSASIASIHPSRLPLPGTVFAETDQGRKNDNVGNGATRNKSPSKKARFSTSVDAQPSPPCTVPNRPQCDLQRLAELPHYFPLWLNLTPHEGLRQTTRTGFQTSGRPISGYLAAGTITSSGVIPPTSTGLLHAHRSTAGDFTFTDPMSTIASSLPVHGPTTGAFDGRTFKLSEFADGIDDTDNARLPLPVVTKTDKKASPSKKVIRIIKQLPRHLYASALLHLPGLYSTRVARILEDAELTMPEVRKFFTPIPPHRVLEKEAMDYADEGNEPLLSVTHFKATWESFVDNIMREWNTLNIISVLLLSAILTMLQIQGSGDDPVTRTAALLALICALMSLLFGGMCVVRFGSMKRTHQALTWTEEVKKINKSIWWNVWVLLAMPAVWLSWSLIMFAICILSFVWRTGSSTSPPSTGLFVALPPHDAMGPRVIITSVFFLGLIYFVLIIKTLRGYGTRMDQKWKQKVLQWAEEDLRLAAAAALAARNSGLACGESYIDESSQAQREGVAPAPQAHCTTTDSGGMASPQVAIPVLNPQAVASATVALYAARSAAILVNETGIANAAETYNSNTLTSTPLLGSPFAFFRPPRGFASYGHFHAIRLIELKFLALRRLKLPPVLDDHDIFGDDWATFMNDLSLAWSGHFPATSLKSDYALREHVQIVIDIVNKWNENFFLSRGVEIVLCMEELKRLASRSVQFVLYLTHHDPVKEFKLERGKPSRQKLAPVMPWANCIPEYVREVVSLTGRYAQLGRLELAVLGNASVEMIPTCMEDSVQVGGRRRINSM